MGEVPWGSENSFWQRWELHERADSTESSHFLSKNGKIRVCRAEWEVRSEKWEPRESGKGWSFSRPWIGKWRRLTRRVWWAFETCFRCVNVPLKLNELLRFGPVFLTVWYNYKHTDKVLSMIIFFQIRMIFFKKNSVYYSDISSIYLEVSTRSDYWLLAKINKEYQVIKYFS